VNPTDGAGTPPPGSGDDELLAGLESLGRDTAPPPDLAERARRAFELRRLDAELAILTSDSARDAAPVDTGQELLAVRRSLPAARQVAFESSDGRLSLELTLTATGSRHQLEGHVLPVGPVEVAVDHESVPVPGPVTSDAWGGFVVEDVTPGLVRVICRRPGERPVTSGWLWLP
jgi:hypothetical protein